MTRKGINVTTWQRLIEQIERRIEIEALDDSGHCEGEGCEDVCECNCEPCLNQNVLAE